MKAVDRFEDMSPKGKLRLILAPDGDIGIEITEGDDRGALGSRACGEFTIPEFGGGDSPRTYDALRALFEAMEADNAERAQHR
jgi:hypothetical protein